MKKYRLNIVTNNPGKYEYISSLLDDNGIFKCKMVKPYNPVIENNNSLKNAIEKCSSMRYQLEDPILTTDEELYLQNVPSWKQPGAFIKQNIETDNEIYKYYDRLFSEINSIMGEIFTNYCISCQDTPIICFRLMKKIHFKYPGSKIILPGRPLASFHYIDALKKFYSETNPTERKKYNKPESTELINFIKTYLSLYFC